MNPMVKLAASALPGERKYILFAGAGVSKDAGIPTAWDLMLKTAALLYTAEDPAAKDRVNLEEWFASSPYAGMGYSELMGELYPNHPDQQSFLSSFLGDKPIGEAHKLIAELARRGIIRAIVTTNFDDCLERALEEKGLKAQVISTEEDLEHSEPLIHCKQIRVYKPHGDLGRGALRNTPIDLEQLAPLMEQELIRVLGEHGVIVVGYSGADKGIQKVFAQRSHRLYPLFWVNLRPPEGEIGGILGDTGYTYIECKGASQFLGDYIQLGDRLERQGPVVGKGPSIWELKTALDSNANLAGPSYSDFLSGITNDLKKSLPDFSRYSERDDAIVEQVDKGLHVTARFIEGALLAARYDNDDALRAVYQSFGEAIRLYEPPDEVSQPFYESDFDGFKFLAYEMFLSFMSSLVRYGRWERIGKLLENEIFVEDEFHSSSYAPFYRVNVPMPSFYERAKRLRLREPHAVGTIIKQRFEGELSEYFRFGEIMEADYFLFMRTACHEEDPKSPTHVWWPRTCSFMDFAPSFVKKAESQAFLNRSGAFMRDTVV